MGILQNKIDFVALVSVTMANPNGDPQNGNRPRVDYEGYSKMSDVCIKRKLRNRMQDLGYSIFVQSGERCADGFKSLRARADNELAEEKDREAYIRKACETWMDVRAFGQLFAFSSKGGKGGKGEIPPSVRGPVSIHQAVSVSPVDVETMQITKSVNGDDKKAGGEDGMSSDRMGQKHFVRFGLYVVKGAINVQLAEKTGFTHEDAQVLKECLRTMFVNDASAARPDGSMEVQRLYWWEHNNKVGQYSSARVHRSVKIELCDGKTVPACMEDYRVTLEPLPGLEPEVLQGV